MVPNYIVYYLALYEISPRFVNLVNICLNMFHAHLMDKLIGENQTVAETKGSLAFCCKMVTIFMRKN